MTGLLNGVSFVKIESLNAEIFMLKVETTNIRPVVPVSVALSELSWHELYSEPTNQQDVLPDKRRKKDLNNQYGILTRYTVDMWCIM